MNKMTHHVRVVVAYWLIVLQLFVGNITATNGYLRSDSNSSNQRLSRLLYEQNAAASDSNNVTFVEAEHSIHQVNFNFTQFREEHLQFVLFKEYVDAFMAKEVLTYYGGKSYPLELAKQNSKVEISTVRRGLNLLDDKLSTDSDYEREYEEELSRRVLVEDQQILNQEVDFPSVPIVEKDDSKKKDHHRHPILPAFNHSHCNSENKLNVLILGDSIDRFMLYDYCRKSNGFGCGWGQNFSYKVGAPAAYVCFVGRITIGMLNLYGSGPKGPYLHNHMNTPDDPYADTELRIFHGIKQFKEAYGEPQFVMIRTALWDLHTKSSRMESTVDESKLNKTEILQTYIANMERNIEQIHRLLPNTYVGTHTVPVITWGLHMFHDYMNANRYLSHALRYFFIYDWTLALLGQDTRSYLRDVHHPNPHHTATFTEMILHSMENWLMHLCKSDGSN